MTDEKPEIFKIDTIPSETMVEIRVSGAYYIGLQNMFMGIAAERPEAEFKKVLEKLKLNNPPADKYEFQIHMLLSLIYEIETKAKAQGLTKLVEIDPSKIKSQD